MTANARLTRSAAHIDAVDIGGDQWAHYATEAGTWWITDSDTLESLCDYLDHADAEVRRDAYSHWCNSGDAEEVSDTDHDTLDRICDAGGSAEDDYRCQCGRATGVRCEWTGRRDRLVTVRWVPESDRGSARASGTYTSGAYAQTLYVTPRCADVLAHVYVDGEQTDELDEYVRVVGPAYA